MKNAIRNTLLSSVLLSGFAFAQTPAPAAPAAGDATPPVKAKTAQQQKMTDCNKQATGKKGDERKTFMSSCLKGDGAMPAPAADVDKQAACEAAAKSKDGKPLSGAAKSSSVKSCMKKAA